MVSYLKKPIFRSEPLRRAVASLPCVCCGREGMTQAAHIGGLEDGKGFGIKVADSRIAALCVDCHQELDQHKMVDPPEDAFIAETYIALMEAGLLKVSK